MWISINLEPQHYCNGNKTCLCSVKNLYLVFISCPSIIHAPVIHHVQLYHLFDLSTRRIKNGNLRCIHTHFLNAHLRTCSFLITHLLYDSILIPDLCFSRMWLTDCSGEYQVSRHGKKCYKRIVSIPPVGFWQNWDTPKPIDIQRRKYRINPIALFLNG